MLSLEIKNKKYIILKFDYKRFDFDILKQKNIFNITFEKDCISLIIEESIYDKSIDIKWFVFKINEKLNFELSGVLSAYIEPLAISGISILVISSFDTDYIFIDEKNIDKALLVFNKKDIKIIKETT